jgi:hypothetical protein
MESHIEDASEPAKPNRNQERLDVVVRVYNPRI